MNSSEGGDEGQYDEEETDKALSTPMANDDEGIPQGLTQRTTPLNQNQGKPVTVKYSVDVLGEFPPITDAQPQEEAKGSRSFRAPA